MKEIYYICYNGDKFTSLNADYKNGITIATLEKKDRWYRIKDVFISPDKNVKTMHGNFYSNTHGSIILESDKHKIINILFTTWEVE